MYLPHNNIEFIIRFRAELWLDGIFQVTKNFELTEKSTVSTHNNYRYLYAGNQPSNSGFQGCLGTYRFNGLDVPLDMALGGSDIANNEVNHLQRRQTRTRREAALFTPEAESTTAKIQRGCRQLATCQTQGVSYCPFGQVCQDFWKGPFCVCPEGNHASLASDGTLARCNQQEAIASLSISRSAVALIIISLLLLLCKILVHLLQSAI